MTMFAALNTEVTKPPVNIDTTLTMTVIVGQAFLRPLGDGRLMKTNLATVDTPDNWMDDARKGGSWGAEYEAMLTQSSGDAPTAGPTLANWHTINSQLEWEWNTTDVFGGTFEVREIADTGNTDSGTVSLT